MKSHSFFAYPPSLTNIFVPLFASQVFRDFSRRVPFSRMAGQPQPDQRTHPGIVPSRPCSPCCSTCSIRAFFITSWPLCIIVQPSQVLAPSHDAPPPPNIRIVHQLLMQEVSRRRVRWRLARLRLLPRHFTAGPSCPARCSGWSPLRSSTAQAEAAPAPRRRWRNTPAPA